MLDGPDLSRHASLWRQIHAAADWLASTADETGAASGAASTRPLREKLPVAACPPCGGQCGCGCAATGRTGKGR